MIEYINEKIKNTTRHFKFGNVPVVQKDNFSVDINSQKIFKSIEGIIPSVFFNGLKGVEIAHQDTFDKRDTNAFYKDGIFYITSEQDSAADLINDVVHEFAHHVEILYPEQIYGDEEIKTEFIKKREQLRFELRSEGYWTQEYDFKNLLYDPKFDKFLYKRVGSSLLRLVTSGIFIRPYASISIREYFATGFEAYYIGNRETLKKISPILYKKIKSLV